MFYSHSHHSPADPNHPAGGWTHSHLPVEMLMTGMVALIVVWVAAVLFLPIWAH